MAKIGIALSGGGNRASLFNLGVLMYLADVGMARNVNSISSVSGGSVANGIVAQAGSFNEMDGPTFEKQIQPFVRRLASTGPFWGWIGTKLYIGALVALGVVWLLSDWLLVGIGLPAVRTIIPWLLAGAWLLLFSRRNVVCGRAFRALLFSPAGKTTRLRDVGERKCEHVFCATEMGAGEHIYFTGRFIYSYRLGIGQPGDLPLDVPVQASANFPTAFPPRVLRTAPHQFRGGKHASRHLVLLDGGVYDNMAEQWYTGLAGRRQRWPVTGPVLPDIDEIIVINAGTNLPWRESLLLTIPVLNELPGIFGMINILYDNTTTVRRTKLVSDFKAAENNRSSPRGALVMLEQEAFGVAQNAANGGGWTPEQKQRATALIPRLELSRHELDDAHQHSVTVKTTFRGLGPDSCAKVLYHGYMTAMANLHVILGYPLPELLPSRTRFRDLAT